MATLIGNPNLKRLPATSRENNIERSVWDMIEYAPPDDEGGQILIGSGDHVPAGGLYAYVYAFGKDEVLKKDYVIDGLEVSIFRKHGGKLYVPNIDPRGTWGTGGYYVKDADGWIERRTIPNAIHCWDMAFLPDAIYASAIVSRSESRIFRSLDDGLTWDTILKSPRLERYREMVVSGDDGDLFVLGTRADKTPCIHKRHWAEWSSIDIDDRFPTGYLFPHCGLTAFKDGIVYMSHPKSKWESEPNNLHYLKDFDEGAVPIGVFEGVKSIFVQDEVLYVMAGTKYDGICECGVFASRDLVEWEGLGIFDVPCKPLSFAALDGQFYCGIADQSKHSGEIYRLDGITIPEEPDAEPEPDEPTAERIAVTLAWDLLAAPTQPKQVKPGDVWIDTSADNTLKVGK